jgi:hypothetical protein
MKKSGLVAIRQIVATKRMGKAKPTKSRKLLEKSFVR